MTDFLQWWADHWPLLVIAVPAYLLYPMYAEWFQRHGHIHTWGPWEVQGPSDPEPYISKWIEGCTRCDAWRRREP